MKTLLKRIESFKKGICPDCYLHNTSNLKGHWQCACRKGDTYFIYEYSGDTAKIIRESKKNDTELSINGAAKILKIKRSDVWELIETAKLTSYCFDFARIIYKSDADAYLQSINKGA